MVLFVLFPLVSCGNGLPKYGVVLWNADTPLPSTGTIVEASEPDPVTGEVTVSRLDGDDTELVPGGYVRLFSTYEAASRFSRSYRPLVDAFAAARVQAARVRKEPDVRSEVVYRLRAGERVKVVHMDTERVHVGGRTGQWVEVLTAGGQRGYTFSPLLKLPRDTGRTATIEGGAVRPETALENLFDHTWRPSYMAQMIDNGTIRLSALDPAIGLFPDEDEQTIEIRTGSGRFVFATQDPVAVERSTYLFDNGDLRIDAFDDDRVTVTYTQSGTIVSEVYVVLDEPVSEVIEDERERRAALYEQLTEDGLVLVSAAYGVLRFAEDSQEVVWSGRSALEPEIIPLGTDATARVRFDVFLDDGLKDRYTGALTLLFTGSAKPTELAFTYEITDSGVRMTYVPSDAARDHLIQDVEASRLVMFFRRSERSQDAGNTG